VGFQTLLRLYSPPFALALFVPRPQAEGSNRRVRERTYQANLRSVNSKLWLSSVFMDDCLL